MSRRFSPPWIVEQTPGGFKVLDANGQSLAYVSHAPMSAMLKSPTF
jgi:hypothetical protein